MTMNSKPRDIAVVTADEMDRTFDPVSSPEELRQRLSRGPLKTVQDKFTKMHHVPISVLEWQMDWIFGPGCWSISDTTYEDKGPIGKTKGGDVMIGIVCIVKVEAIHPISNFITKQVGVASGFYTYGKFKTEFAAIQRIAFKNACKKWGKVFGRDLNRSITEILSDQWSQKQIMEMWKEQGINDLVSLGKALRLAEKTYGKSQGLNDAFNLYKNKHIANE